MDVSENSGTPKSSISIGFSIINHPFWGTPNFWKNPYPFEIKNKSKYPSLPIPGLPFCEKPGIAGEEVEQLNENFETQKEWPIPAPPKRCQYDPKGWLMGTPHHSFSTP